MSLTAALVLLLAPQQPALPTAGDLASWREHMRPAPEEVAFQEIDWIDDFALGVRASEREGKPLLFWAMNGHPLGCT